MINDNMKNYTYFIKITENVIKFGMFHHRKFVKDKKLTSDLQILNVIGFESKFLKNETERRLKTLLNLMINIL
jgi:hypothetical protein